MEAKANTQLQQLTANYQLSIKILIDKSSINKIKKITVYIKVLVEIEWVCNRMESTQKDKSIETYFKV